MMNPAVQALAYQLDREDAERAADLEQATRIHEDPTLFSPDWAHWWEFLDGELRVLCALSVGLNPAHRFTHIDRARTCVAQMQDAAMTAVTDLLARRDRAIKQLGVSGGLPIERAARGRDPDTARVLRTEFLAWLQRNGWSVNPALSNLRGTASWTEAHGGASLTLLEQRHHAIRRTALELNIDLMADPSRYPGQKTGPKDRIKTSVLTTDSHLFRASGDAFEKAWETYPERRRNPRTLSGGIKKRTQTDPKTD